MVNPPALIPGSVFLAQPYLAYYSKFGFDRNFFTWVDSNGSFSPRTKVTWSGCTPVDDGQPTHQVAQLDGRLLCDPAWTVTDVNGAHDPRHRRDGPVHGFVWRDSSGTIHYVSTACGNWTHPVHAPPPTITGLKFEDLNANGTRDQASTACSSRARRLHVRPLLRESARPRPGRPSGHGDERRERHVHLHARR